LRVCDIVFRTSVRRGEGQKGRKKGRKEGRKEGRKIGKGKREDIHSEGSEGRRKSYHGRAVQESR